MLAVLITLTPGRRNMFIDCQNAKVFITVLLIMDVKTRWNSTLELLERACRNVFQSPTYAKYRPLFTTQDEWMIGKYVMEVLGPLRYWTLWMSKCHTVKLHQVFTVHNDMLDHMDGMMPALAKQKTHWKEAMLFAEKLAGQKLSKYYAEVTPTIGMLLIPTHIRHSVRKL
jgi:uncharacterized membrane protein YpjA